MSETLEKLKLLSRESSARTVMLHTVIGHKVGLTSADLKCLDFIEREGALTAGQIAQLTGLTTGAVTTLIDRLEKKGAVRRESDPKDRRKVLVQKNDTFMRKLWPVYEILGDEAEKMYQKFTPEEQDLLVKFLETTIELSKNASAKIQNTQL